ncbi:hypothetical protein C2845_PM10G05150 [Panicum miliaceum]|uniref:Uncharacterized protein n=1 Tax=Panicum miliaceum TaxID=4540 RepID=A0A3L6PFA3_PANMI|nr:hypothetical protein C2845_PM10G05150 [Panicum miliaceum]
MLHLLAERAATGSSPPLKQPAYRSCAPSPAGIRYPQIAGMGIVYYPWRVAGVGAGVNFSLGT